ncbi:MAG TPA: hypothetical protein VFE27_10050 [Acidobacteriaceae bacterium]|nr:hypothetical protein [Acidobacteriaceae bacterium]
MSLSKIRRTLLPIAVMALVGGCLGCAVRSPRSIYQLSKIDSEYFLLSPDAGSTSGDHQTIRIRRPRDIANENKMPARDCSIKGPWFSLYSDAGNSSFWIAETPSTSASQKSAGTIEMKDQWQSFERALYGLQQRRCFASLREYLSVRQRIAESVSAPAADTLFYRYGYGPGGYVDLTPGMQLQIERDFFGPHTPEQPPLTNYRGTTVTYYKVSGDAGSGTKLMFLKTEKRSIGATTPEVDTSDVSLATEFAAAPRLRLFLEDLEVSGGDKSPAMLIGAPIAEDLNDATQAIESDPRLSCEALLRWHVTCAFFPGVVTVSPMLQIVVNGSPTYVPIGSRLWAVIPQTSNAHGPAVMRTLRVRRWFDNKAVDLRFAPNTDDISQLFLFGGDRITWSRTAAAKR